MAALGYGIEANEIDDPQLRALWSRLQRLHSEMSPLVDQVASTLEVAT